MSSIQKITRMQPTTGCRQIRIFKISWRTSPIFYPTFLTELLQLYIDSRDLSTNLFSKKCERMSRTSFYYPFQQKNLRWDDSNCSKIWSKWYLVHSSKPLSDGFNVAYSSFFESFGYFPLLPGRPFFIRPFFKSSSNVPHIIKFGKVFINKIMDDKDIQERRVEVQALRRCL